MKIAEYTYLFLYLYDILYSNHELPEALIDEPYLYLGLNKYLGLITLPKIQCMILYYTSYVYSCDKTANVFPNFNFNII